MVVRARRRARNTNAGCMAKCRAILAPQSGCSRLCKLMGFATLGGCRSSYDFQDSVRLGRNV
eukprot:7438613-Lingulodinium_polyedra.AAC.1